MHEYELISTPLEVFLAPVGTAFPDPDQAPAGPWELLGKLGDKSYTDDGVTVSLPQTLETFTPAGGTMARKAWRTEEGIVVGTTVADVRAEVLSKALNDNEITEAGGTVSLPLLRGINVTEYALLARGQSPVDGEGKAQFQLPKCYNSSEPEVVFSKEGTPAAVAFEFSALDPGDDADEMVYIYEDAGS